MEKQKRTNRINIPMFFAIALFFATLVSIHFSSGLYARYAASDSAADSARVITFEDITITESGDFNSSNHSAYIIPGVDLTKRVIVDFGGSEAATLVFAEVTLSSNWVTENNQTFMVKIGDKVCMQWALDASWDYLTTENNGNGTKTYVYHQQLIPNTVFEDDIIADAGRITVSDAITKAEMTSLTGITIDIQATAVQSGGFENETQAWNSIKIK